MASPGPCDQLTGAPLPFSDTTPVDVWVDRNLLRAAVIDGDDQYEVTYDT
ncbi:MAG: hypothetical protein FWD75_04475 [Propionibacteriaceae bacterium]|nr:hypothetical protein [Propionibacteriaceae bacterium]